MKLSCSLVLSVISAITLSCGHQATSVRSAGIESTAGNQADNIPPANSQAMTTYTGILPCANCARITATLSLTDTPEEGYHYYLREVFSGLKSGKDETITSDGSYTILKVSSSDPQAVIILLNPEKDKVLQRCFLQKSTTELLLLDNDQRPLPGAAQFILRQEAK